MPTVLPFRARVVGNRNAPVDAVKSATGKKPPVSTWASTRSTSLSSVAVPDTVRFCRVWNPLVGTEMDTVGGWSAAGHFVSWVVRNPDDERYQGMIGKFMNHPLTGRQIPVVADSFVDPAFGTGCVKITPAHDFNDYAIGLRHNLPMINILTDDAKINDAAPEKVVRTGTWLRGAA